LEQLDRVAGAGVQQQLLAARASKDLVAEVQPAWRSRSTSLVMSSTTK
jgi:hypothetical protein